MKIKDIKLMALKVAHELGIKYKKEVRTTMDFEDEKENKINWIKIKVIKDKQK